MDASISTVETSGSSAGNGRPRPVRRETDQILSYYQSELAGRSYTYNATDNGDPDEKIENSSSVHSSSPSSTYSNTFSDEPSTSTVNSNDSPFSQNFSPRRRTSTRSTGGSDKRRVAIVEMDSKTLDSLDGGQKDVFSASGTNSNSRLLSRRGLDGHRIGALAFVVPPDASPVAYSNLTPPLSAPPARRDIVPTTIERNASGGGGPIPGHKRSQSEATTASQHTLRKTSRDVGIVGMSPSSPVYSRMDLAGKDVAMREAFEDAQLSPIFQTPLARDLPSSESSGVRDDTTSSSAWKNKRVSDISPVIVGIPQTQLWQTASNSSSTLVANFNSPSVLRTASISSSVTYSDCSTNGLASPYLHYQPGLHSTAGPLPPPPKQIVPPSKSAPPPRPPRLKTPAPSSSSASRERTAEKQGMVEANSGNEQTQEVTQYPVTHNELTKTVSRTSVTDDTEQPSSSSSAASEHRKGTHVREGATPTASSFRLPHSIADDERQESEVTLLRKHQPSLPEPQVDLSTTVVEKEWPKKPSQLLSKVDEEPTLHASENAIELDLSHSTAVPSSPLLTPESNPSPVRSSNHLDQALAIDLSNNLSPYRTPDEIKNFSPLPKTPSKLSVSRLSNRSSASHERSPKKTVRSFQKIVSTDPDAMWFNEILSERSAHDRAVGYADKINNLARHDSGLSDWVVTTRRSLIRNKHNVKRRPISTMDVRGPSERPFVGQVRHTSEGSVGSEATFPRRDDAYVATDLSWKAEEVTLTEGPNLPYPALAQPGRILASKSFGGLSASSSIRSVQSTPNTSKSGGGFFASIGRKASSKKDKLSPASPSKRPSQPASIPPPLPPRPIQINASPSLPGGPRAPPNRLQRTQSVVAPPKSSSVTSSPHMERRMSRRLSIKHVSHSSALALSSNTIQSEEEFNKQVSKLSDLLPDADKSILAGYLRRCGQDMLAIGQYLEDQKNWTIRRD